ncbi:MAG TPA: AmmeMemoRadiSam system protein A [Bacillota bacterium]|nr:AmmeMemoRadiSam system protein A [Bacillota bacterium]
MVHFGALLPHPPIIVEGIGGPADREQAGSTIAAMQTVDRLLGADPPDTLIVFTPHGTIYQDAIIIYADQQLSGGLRQFGLERTWSWETDRELAEEIGVLGQAAGLPVYLMEQRQAAGQRGKTGLDHGVLVPLSFFNPEWANRVKLVVIPLSLLPLEELYQFGNQVREAVARLGRKTAIIASGDLSHCLTANAPSAYNPKGAEFDRKLVELIQQSAVKEFMEFDPELLGNAAECGFRSLIMLLGAFDRIDFRSQVHSYEGPFGVGYAVATFQPVGERLGFTADFFARREQQVLQRKAAETPLVRFARGVVESYVQERNLPEPLGLEDFRNEQAGVFVSIKKHGELRGCIGTIEATRDNVIDEIRENAVAAATRDPRFNPIEADELDHLVYSVDILKPAEPATGIHELDPKRYGVIVRSGHRTGLLLPNLEGVNTAEEQVAIAKRKAGISPHDPVELERFEVVRYY